MQLKEYPFEKLTLLLENSKPNQKYIPSTLTIGEPQFQTPQFIQNELKNNTDLLNKYPKTKGEEYLRESMITFVSKRFKVKLTNSQIIPTLGTKEVLFNFPQYALFDKKNPTIAFPNPFYQIYEGAAIASRATIIHMDMTKENNYIASLSEDEMKKTDIVIINYPNNPTTAVISKEELAIWVKNALKYDFILINDECYSELYFNEDKKPVSLLEACIEVGNDCFKNCLVMNSISKRSSAPGLRSGFIAGDSEILNGYMTYRSYVGSSIPLPLQKTAAIAWSDEVHVEEFRQNYKENFKIAQEILNIDMPEATFYIWLEVNDELKFTKELYEQKNIKVLPGSFIGRNGIGKNYVRIALVETAEKTREVLNRIKDFISLYQA